MTHDLTDNGMRLIFAEELRKQNPGMEGLALAVESGTDNSKGGTAAFEAMTRIRDAAYEEAAKAAENATVSFDEFAAGKQSGVNAFHNGLDHAAAAIRSLSKPLEKDTP